MVSPFVGTRIRERREAIGLKQSQLAREIGISASYLNLIEHNRRRIAGKVLLDIATRLNTNISSLQDGAETALVQNLQKAAIASDNPVEIDRIEEMVGRFPGWARLTADLQTKSSRLDRIVTRLNDRLTHDPFLSESLHEMLSNITAIYSTAGILKDMPDIDPTQQSRFHSNLFDESERLSEISQALVSYFDQMAEGEKPLSTPLDEVDAFLRGHGFWFPKIEGSNTHVELLASSTTLTSHASRTLAADLLQQVEIDRKSLPLDEFLVRAKVGNFRPDLIALSFGCDLATVFRRLAFLASSEDHPDFGLISCDISGAVTFRKSLPGFSLPMYGAACPLWPLYQSLAQPQVPLRYVLETPEGAHFVAYAQSHVVSQPAFGRPQVIQADMLFHPLPAGDQTQTSLLQSDVVKIGLSCRICPRQNCQARREPTILSDTN
ncbi:MAG: transcriptional regulator with XRE-family HTH domain [Paracoccaceae bacterium]